MFFSSTESACIEFSYLVPTGSLALNDGAAGLMLVVSAVSGSYSCHIVVRKLLFCTYSCHVQCCAKQMRCFHLPSSHVVLHGVNEVMRDQNALKSRIFLHAVIYYDFDIFLEKNMGLIVIKHRFILEIGQPNFRELKEDSTFLLLTTSRSLSIGNAV